MPTPVDAFATASGRAPAALITATGSGQGKSMVTAALARLHRNAGRRVRVFKHGPDYLDPMLQTRASGQPVYNLHPWMTGEQECRWRLAAAAAEADVVLVEGSMGLFDGDPSSADLARLCGLPVMPVINAWGVAETFGAIALGLARLRDDVVVQQVIANCVGSERHARMIADRLPNDIELLGAIPRDEALRIPERHLGLVQAGEIDDLDARLDRAAAVLAEAGLDRLPTPVTLAGTPPPAPPRRLAGMRIGIARDDAFAFIYPANLDLLAAMGAELRFFSPLVDHELPAIDALWLPGGYPELHAAKLARNTAMRDAIHAHHAAGRPTLAECGGLLYCMASLIDADGIDHGMLGLLPGRGRMTGRLAGLGLQALATAEGELRGHTFHHARLETEYAAATHTRRQHSDRGGELVFRRERLTATYFHAYFPSAPAVTATLFRGDWHALRDDLPTPM